MKNIENYKTRFYTLMESTMGDVKPLISEEETSDVFEKSECYDANGNKIPCENTQEMGEVKLITIQLKQNVANPFGIEYIRYRPSSGTILNARTSEKIATIEKNLSTEELAKWLRKNRLIKRSQLRNIKKDN